LFRRSPGDKLFIATQTTHRNEQKMTTKTVSVQAVAAAILATKGITKSSKYSSSAREIRSSGVYTNKNIYDEIVIGFWDNSRSQNLYKPESDLAKVTATLESKGFAVITKTKTAWTGKSSYLVVEVA